MFLNHDLRRRRISTGGVGVCATTVYYIKPPFFLIYFVNESLFIQDL